jgi:hypothetical protein
VLRVQREHLLLARRIDRQVAAREHGEGQPMFVEQFPQRLRLVTKLRKRFAAQLDRAEADGRYVLHRFDDVGTPCNRRIAVLDRQRICRIGGPARGHYVRRR